MFRQSVNRFIKRHHLLTEGAAVVVGVSGGPDSMALLDHLNNLKQQWNLKLIAASVDHGFRGQESARDVVYVKEYCRRHHIQFEGTFLDVDSYMKEEGLSLQQAARDCRYRFFETVMEQYCADILALGHHGDDQVETMLMRQVRGSFGTARSGIPFKRAFAGGHIIRPLLTVSKREIEMYLRGQGVEPRRDPSNERDDYTRNRFRHHVVPFLKEENPSVHLRFQYDSEMLTDDHLFLEQLAEEKLASVILKKSTGKVVLSKKAFASVPKALQRRMIHLVLNYLYVEAPSSLSSVHIESLFEWLAGVYPSGRLDFPRGLHVTRSYDEVTFTFFDEEKHFSYLYRLHADGKILLPVGAITAEIRTYNDKVEEGRDFFSCDADRVSFPLIIRTRQPGDRLFLKGMNGSKKVKAIFIDQKVAQPLRERWPVVTDQTGEILWLPGLKHSSAAEITAETKRLLILRFQSSDDL